MPISLSGSLIITGSMTTSGTITAQTLVVQTITSSIVNLTGSNIFGSQLTNRQTFTGSMFVTGSGTFTSTISAIGESTLFRGVFNDPVPNTAAVLKMSSTPTPSALSTVVGARMSGSATANFDSYAGYFSNIALSSGTGLSYGIFATASFHTFIGETRLAQGVFNDPVAGTAASVKISATPVSGYPTAVFTAGATGAASSGQNTFAGYFTNTSTVSGGGVNYGIYATGSSHYFGGSVGIGITAPSSILHISASSSTITGKVILQSPSSDSGILQIGSSYGEASMMFIPGVTAFGTSSPVRTSSFGNAALWGLGPGTYTSDPTKFGIANVGFGNNVLTVSSSCALGIGTTNPTTRLFVLGSGTYNTTTSEILTSDATIFSSEMSNDAYNSILQLVSVRQSLTTGASSNGFLGFSTIDDSNGEGIRDAGRIAIVNETAASRNSATALGFWTNTGGTKTTAATEKLRISSTGAATFSSTIKGTSTGVDGTYADIFISQYSSNNSETNAIQTAVSSIAASSGFRFQVSNGGGSSARTSMMDITRSGVKFQNGSSYLSYYEEGSWTPALQNATVSYSERSGTYTRIGNYVFVRWGFRISTISGTSGTVTISGLPFTAVSWGSYQEPNISVSTGVLATADNAFKARVYKGGGDTSLYGRVSVNSDTSWNTSDLQNGTWIIGEIFYNV